MGHVGEWAESSPVLWAARRARSSHAGEWARSGSVLWGVSQAWSKAGGFTLVW